MSKFKPEFIEQVEKLCKLGATDKQLADFFNVDERTINRWKDTQEQFCQSLKKGKLFADAEVADALFHRAKGYSHPEEKIMVVDGQVERIETIKHYPPDTTACIFWLKNRAKEQWRDKQEVDVEHSNSLENPVQVILPHNFRDEEVLQDN